MRIGFIGLGKMGTPMALRLLAAGHELSVWNRTEERTKPLIHEGAIAAATPAEAELGADAVITMLRDDAAYDEVFFGVYRLIDALSPGMLSRLLRDHQWVSRRAAHCKRPKRGIDFVGARVIGRLSDVQRDAEQGRLSIVAAGADCAMVRAIPLLETFSREITVAGAEPYLAYAMRPEACPAAGLIAWFSKSARTLFAGVARCPHVVMRDHDMRILRIEQLLDWQRQFFFQRFLIRLLRRILAGFGGLEQGVISAAEVSLDVAPGAVHSSAQGAFFFHIVKTLLMQNFFNVAAELRTLQDSAAKKRRRDSSFRCSPIVSKPSCPSMRLWTTDSRVSSTSLLFNLRVAVSVAICSFLF